MIQSWFGRNRYKTADAKKLSSPALMQLDMLAEEALRTAQAIQKTVAQLREQDTQAETRRSGGTHDQAG